MKSERIYRDGEYIGYIKDRGGYGCDRWAFCLPGGGVLFTRATYAEVKGGIWEWL